jgi:hypothetical protein
MRGAATLWRGHVVVEHELHVVRAVGHAHVHPAEGRRVRGTAAPELLEAQNAVVELRRGVEVPDQDADMHGVFGEAGRRHVLARVFRRPAIRPVLHELDGVAVRILHCEVLVPGSARAHLPGHLDAPRCEIVAQAVGVVGIEGDVIELAFPGRWPVEQLDPLVVVDLDEGDIDRAVRLWQRKGLVEPEQVSIEGPRSGQVADIHRQVRHPQDSGTYDSRLRQKRQRHQRDDEAFHAPRLPPAPHHHKCGRGRGSRRLSWTRRVDARSIACPCRRR